MHADLVIKYINVIFHHVFDIMKLGKIYDTAAALINSCFN